MTVRGIGSSKQPQTYLTEDGVVCHDLTGFSHLTMDLVRQLYRQHIRLRGAQPARIMLLANDVLTVEFQVQLYASHPDLQRSIKALAIVGNAFMAKHLYSMFVSYHPPEYPVKQFDEQAQAEVWLGGVSSQRNQA